MQTPQSPPPPVPVAASNTEQKLADAKAWMQFIQIASLTIGAGLLLAGIIFFFAYNWDAIHRFAKMGIAAGLLLVVFLVVMIAPMRNFTRNIAIFAMCVSVGVFWIIFGQAYQVQADSPTLFLTWALCIAIWVYVADFYPLWAFFVVLLAMGVIPYNHLLIPREGWELSIMMIYSAAWFAFFYLTPRWLPSRTEAPSWLLNTLFVMTYYWAIFSMCRVVFTDSGLYVFIALIAIAACIWYTMKHKKILLFSWLLFGALCLLECLLIQLFDLGGIVINIIAMIGAFTMATVLIVHQHEEWSKDKPEDNNN